MFCVIIYCFSLRHYVFIELRSHDGTAAQVTPQAGGKVYIRHKGGWRYCSGTGGSRAQFLRLDPPKNAHAIIGLSPLTNSVRTKKVSVGCAMVLIRIQVMPCMGVHPRIFSADRGVILVGMKYIGFVV